MDTSLSTISLVGIIGLVVGLMVLNLTVSTVTINGLLFYANIVRANTATFFLARQLTHYLAGS